MLDVIAEERWRRSGADLLRPILAMRPVAESTSSKPTTMPSETIATDPGEAASSERPQAGETMRRLPASLFPT
jgi:hypothetical protein